MAWDIQKSDMPWVVQMAMGGYDSRAWWNFVRSNTTDPDVQGLANAIVSGLDGGAKDFSRLMQDLRDDLHTLADLDTEVEVQTQDELGNGETRTYSVRTRGLL